MATTKLEVNNLKISFRTNNGRVQAVRDISFHLDEGETLAIVGESGSGKSVTSRAIMGILAPNAIVESGEILYDGKDLMQIDEEEFHSLRGDKIAMVFQDPLSSLNPIVRIGKQLTEAMILKNKLSRKESKVKLNNAFKILSKNINEASGTSKNKLVAKENSKNINIFKKFTSEFIRLQNEYNNSIENIKYAIQELNTARVLLEKNIKEKLLKCVSKNKDYVLKGINNFTYNDNDKIVNQSIEILTLVKTEQYNSHQILNVVDSLLEKFNCFVNQPTPNFFSLAYYLLYNNNIPTNDINELNIITRKYLDDEFMLSFIDVLEKGVDLEFNKRNEAKKYAIAALEDLVLYVKSNDVLNKKEVNSLFDNIYPLVKNCENPLRIGKDTYTSTFKGSIKKQLTTYFSADKVNALNERKYTKEKAKFDRIIAKGKKPTYTVAEVNKIDNNLAKKNIVHIIEKLIDNYKNDINKFSSFNSHEYTIAIIDYLKDLSSKIVTKVSQRSAKESALRIMEEVGIPDPAKRFRQYPFQFSGGMRQRIVIAIALSANPDVLICDEPTTALDVTIQAQILELINKLKKERNLSIIFITHDLGVVANMADRIAVMYAGKIVEYGLTDEIFYDPKHPYTWALLSSVPDLETKEKLSPIPGTPPNMIYPPKGDAFAPRNKYAMKIDFEKQPPLFKVSDTHYAATWLLHPNAPKTNPPSIVLERINRMMAESKGE